MSEQPTLLVTGLGSYGEQILKSLKHPEAVPCRVIGVDINPNCVHFRAADAAMITPRADTPEFIDAILHVCDHFEVSAIFPGCEPDLDRLVAERDLFERRGILVMAAPLEMIAICRDKLAASERLLELGFDPPRFALLKTLSDIADVDWYPVVVKPQRSSGGSRDCYIAQTQRELELLFELMGGNTSLFAQEYVGTPDNEFTVGVLLDLEGNLINSIALRRDLDSQLNLRLITRNRTGKACLGSHLVISSGISQGAIDNFPDVTGPCEKIALAIGARGAINVQCRRVDGKVKVFEINPRFSGTTFIRAMMGYNEPDVLVRRHLLGEKIPVHFAFRRGHVVRSLNELMLSGHAVASWTSIRPE